MVRKVPTCKRKGRIYRMPSKEELGRRLRIARFDRNLTLKEVASRCGMSATHISEVERGKTSPTIGALQRIAAALGERSSYFVRDDELPEVRLTKLGQRYDFYMTDATGKPASLQVVAKGLPRGYLQLFSRHTEPGQVTAGEAVFIVVKGTLRVTVGDESHVLREGDTLQARLDGGFTSENVGEDVGEVMLVLATPMVLPL